VKLHAAVVLFALAACAPNRGAQYPNAFAEAQRAETAGRYAEAAEKYEAAAKVAVRPRDRDHALYISGLMLMRAERVKDGIARLESVAAGSSDHAADATYRVASARIEHGDEARGWREMEIILERFSSRGIAHSAFRQLLIKKDEESTDAALVWLRGLDAGPLAKSELGESIAYGIAERLARKEDWAAAHDQYLLVARRFPYPRGALWDDSLYKASEMDEKLKRFPHAIEDLEKMLAERETTTLVGSYQRPRMSPALLRMGILYRDGLSDRARARDAFRRLYADFKTSSLRDDALWLEADLWSADGNENEACARLGTLLQDFPDSRYVPCATTKCPTLKRPEKSKAPAECRDYLTRPGRIPK
jgi:tetratricopeptide (TPR) repeat protein